MQNLGPRFAKPIYLLNVFTQPARKFLHLVIQDIIMLNYERHI